MKVIIKSGNIEISEAIRAYIEMKTKSFERPITKFIVNKAGRERNPIEDRKQRISTFWEIGTQKGLFFCKVQLSIPGQSKHIKAEATEGDLYAAIDKVKDIITSQIVEVKDKPIDIKKRAVRKNKRITNLDPASKDSGEGGRTLDESA